VFLVALSSLASLWWFASPAAPRWLERLALPLSAASTLTVLVARPRGVAAAIALGTCLVVLAAEVAFTLLARL
jgi:hypothetical protein